MVRIDSQVSGMDASASKEMMLVFCVSRARRCLAPAGRGGGNLDWDQHPLYLAEHRRGRVCTYIAETTALSISV